MSLREDFLEALRAHDHAVEKRGRTIWVGAEPTYTDRFSEAPEWLREALGEDKRKRAEGMLARLAQRQEGAAVLRSVGRQYSGESKPRWSLGIYERRDGSPVWSGSPDPAIIDVDQEHKSPTPTSFALELVEQLKSTGFNAQLVEHPLTNRVVFRTDNEALLSNPQLESELARPSLHSARVEGIELVDELSQSGNYLIVCDEHEQVVRVELPAIPSVELFQQLLGSLSKTSLRLGASSIILAGHPPPVDSSVSWTTITADPAVIEANMAPQESVTELFHRLYEIHRAATAEGLDSYRLQYNGLESDSGGGGQITFGGPSPEASPFFSVPSLLPSLIRYVNRHPSLSYLHAFDSVGPSSQSPRADEGVPGALPELALALELLERVENPLPETLWRALAPFLADLSGNAHRAEINVEKLWNPGLGARGQQGLVEFRALRMGPTSKATAAIAALLRAILAMLADDPCKKPLIDWGTKLHDQFSLPFHLQADLNEVLSDLDRAGLGLGAPITRELLDRHDLLMTSRQLGNTRFELRRAMEFWPLVGDAASQERRGSRLIDASTQRLEIRLESASQFDRLEDWTLTVGDWNVSLRSPVDGRPDVRLAGLRYRNFKPWLGLHQTLDAQSPLTFNLYHPTNGAWRITVHEWRPTEEAYSGLPANFDEARARREERCVVEAVDKPSASVISPPPQAIGEYIVDLRWR